jgi:hypothetical protein
MAGMPLRREPYCGAYARSTGRLCRRSHPLPTIARDTRTASPTFLVVSAARTSLHQRAEALRKWLPWLDEPPPSAADQETGSARGSPYSPRRAVRAVVEQRLRLLWIESVSKPFSEAVPPERAFREPAGPGSKSQAFLLCQRPAQDA